MHFPNPPTSIVRYLSIVIVSLILLSATASSRAQTVDQQDVPLLEPSKPVKRTIGGGESHYYRIALMTDQYVQIQVDQRGVDVRVKLFQPDGNVVAESNRLTGPYGPETISWVAQSPGSYKLEVRSIERSERAEYEVRLSEERVATFQDRNRLAPQSVFMQAERLRDQKTPQSLGQAIAKYEEAVQVARDVNDAQWQAEALNTLGLIYQLLKRDSPNARQRFEKALQIRQSSGDRRGEAETLTNFARTYESSGQYPIALEYYTRALKSWQDAGDQYGQASALDNIGRIHYLSKDGTHALDFQKRAQQMWHDLGDAAREAAALNNMGDSYVLVNDYNNALSTYEDARKRFHEAGDRDGEVAVLFSISGVYKTLGNKQKEDEYNKLAEGLAGQIAASRVPTPEEQARWTKTERAEEAQAEARKLLDGSNSDQRKAIEKFEEAARIFDSIAEYDREVFTLFDISATYRILKDKNKDRQTLERALSLAKRVRSNALQAETYKQLADYYLADSNAQRAVESYDSAIALWQKQGDRSSEAYVLAAAAQVYSKLGDKQKPREYLERALRLYQGLGDRFREAYTLDDLAKINNQPDTRPTALDYLKQTRDLRRANHDRSGEAQSLKEIIAVYTAMGRKQETLDYYHQALALYIETRDGMGAAEILRDLMTYWKEQNRRRLAIFYGKQAVNTYQEIRRNIQGLEQQTQESFINAKEEVYRLLADLLIDEGRFPEAQQVLSMLKEEEIHNYIRDNKKDPSAGDAPMTPSESELYAKYKAFTEQSTAISKDLENILARKSMGPGDTTRKGDLQDKLDKANAEFYNYLSNNAKEVLDPGKFDTMVSSIEGLRSTLRKLGPGVVALYTLVVEEKYRVILFTPGVNVARQYSIKKEDLNHKIMAFRQQLSKANADPLPAAQELYNILIRPMEDDLKRNDAKTLMWSLDRSLRYLPIAALHDGKKYMVEDYKNEVFTPASIANLGEDPNRNWRALAFGVSKALKGLDPLPSVIDELKGIFRDEDKPKATGGLLPGKIYLDDQVKKDVMLDAIGMQQYSLVHIASHFDLNSTNELLSYLVLGDGTTISAAELRVKSTLFYNVDLLTLSACNTGVAVGKDDGKEVDSFADVTQKQGAKAVIASLWAVADPSTAALMQKFYQFRVQNSQDPMSKAAALQEAQLALLHKQVTARDKDYAHPYYWAPFILIGNWR